MDVEIVGKFLSVLPEDDDHPYRTGPRRPQTTEWDADDLNPVEGEIPADLDGVYLRDTENPLHPALKTYHPFDGDGMLHVVGFRDGKTFYRNRFVRTDGSRAETDTGGPLWPGLAEPVQLARGENGGGARTPMKDAVLPRRGGSGDIRWFEADSTFVLHFVNAYEGGDEIVLDGFLEGDPSPLNTGGTEWDKLFRFLALDRLQSRLHR